MKKSIFILLIVALTSCIFDTTPIYIQFTKDDLSYLHYNKDTLINTGQDIYYTDTISYLLNDSDSIQVKIATKIYSYFSEPWIQKYKEISGKSSMSFNRSSGFSYANMTIIRGSNAGYPVRSFEVGANGTWNFSKQYLYNDTIKLDTALVHGKIYQYVYKFYPPIEGKTNIRLIYFAKKYGYIKIEKLDGTKIERIDNGQ